MTSTDFIRCVPEKKDVPPELAERNQWVCWKITGEDVKLPINIHTGGAASSTRPETWASLDQALQYLANRPALMGIGYVFAPDDPFTGIDLDNVRDPETGIIDPEALDLMSRFDTYREISPSGTGIKMWIRGRKMDGPCALQKK